jgi:hypothetical protein
MEKYWQKVTKIFHLLPFKVKIHKIYSFGIGKRGHHQKVARIRCQARGQGPSAQKS